MIINAVVVVLDYCYHMFKWQANNSFPNLKSSSQSGIEFKLIQVNNSLNFPAWSRAISLVFTIFAESHWNLFSIFDFIIRWSERKYFLINYNRFQTSINHLGPVMVCNKLLNIWTSINHWFEITLPLLANL